MTGEDKIKGTIYVRMKIGAIEKRTRMFVVDKKEFKYDVLIGIDSIMSFRLRQDHLCRISQVPVEVNEDEASWENGMPLEVNDQPTSEVSVNWNEYIPIEKFDMKVEHLEKKKEGNLRFSRQIWRCFCEGSV